MSNLATTERPPMVLPGDSIENERRLMGLEFGQEETSRRLDRIEESARLGDRREFDRERMLTTMRAKLDHLQSGYDQLQKGLEKLGEHHMRFIFAFALGAGGLIINVLRTKLGL